MKPYWTTKKFKQLERKWEEKLRASGFTDIERTEHGERVLITLTRVALDSGNKAEYYRQVRNNMWEATYDTELDKHVMRRVGLGWQIRDICKGLPYSYERGRQIVRRIAHKYETRWGIRKWTSSK